MKTLLLMIASIACAFAGAPNPQIAFTVSVNANGVEAWDGTTGYLWLAGNLSSGTAPVSAISPATHSVYCSFSISGNATGMVVNGNQLYIATSNGLYHTNVANQIATGCAGTVGLWDAGVSMNGLAIMPYLGQLWTAVAGIANVYSAASGAFLFSFSPPDGYPVAWIVPVPNIDHSMFVATYFTSGYGPQNDVYLWDGDGGFLSASTLWSQTFHAIYGSGVWDARQGEVIWPALSPGEFYTDQPGSGALNSLTWFLSYSPVLGQPCTSIDYDVNTGVLAETCQSNFAGPAGVAFAQVSAWHSGYVLPTALVAGAAAVKLNDTYAFVVSPGSPGTMTAVSY